MRRVIVVAVLLLGGCKGQDAGESPGGEASAARSQRGKRSPCAGASKD